MVRLGVLHPREVNPWDVPKVAEYPVIRIGRDETGGEDVGRHDGPAGFARGFRPHPQEPRGEDTGRGLEHPVRAAVTHRLEVYRKANLGKPRVSGHEAVRADEAVLLARGEHHDQRAAGGCRIRPRLLRPCQPRLNPRRLRPSQPDAEQRVGICDDVSHELDGDRRARRVVGPTRRCVNGVHVNAHEHRGSRPALALGRDVVVAASDAYREGCEVSIHHQLLVPRISADVQRELAAVRVLHDVDVEPVVANLGSRRLDRPQLFADEIECPGLCVGTRGARSSRFHVAREFQRSAFREDRRRRILRRGGARGVFRQGSGFGRARGWRGGAHLGDGCR